MGTFTSKEEKQDDNNNKEDNKDAIGNITAATASFVIDNDLLDHERTSDHPPAMYRLSYGRLSRTIDAELVEEPVIIKQFVKNTTDRDFRQEFLLVHHVLGPHPNIVRYYDFHCGFTMLFMPRYHCSLYDVFRTTDDLDHPLALRNVFLQMATALAFCHSRFVAHRDVKIENFLVDRVVASPPSPCLYEPSTTLIKLCDFEFAMQCASFETKVAEHCGSIFYASPELLSKYDFSPFASDVWALGVSLFILAFNRYPFHHDASADADTSARMVAKQITLTNVVVPHHPSELLQTLLYQMLMRNPLRRPTAQQLIACPYVLQ